MEIVDTCKMAVSALLSNKLRSSLTMLGIIIGNASVIGMVAVGQGAQKLTAEQFQSLGPNVLFLSLTSARVRHNLSAEAKPLLLEDAQAIAKLVPTLTHVAPEIHTSELIVYQDKIFQNSIIGTTPEYLPVRNYELSQGRFLNEIDVKHSNRVVVLGAVIAERLFPNQNPLGKQVRIKNMSFNVIGVLAPKGSLFDSDQDNNVIVPLTAAHTQLRGWRSPYGINLNVIAMLAKDQDTVRAAEFQVKNLIQLRHSLKDSKSLKLFSQNALLETAEKTNAGLTQMLGAIAVISLLVGGIGVMNIMLVSVTERTKEVGLRKALGATEQDILGQFLLEAILLTTLGGVIGIGVGIGGVIIASSVFSLATSISVESIILAVGVSGGIGLFFGVLPAKQAAKLDPIVALRSA
ncbi:ABC transporter permease [Crocosphaera sp. XPORK-15E]|uniref:ABC transporter permease n=1 Tax=Crocosphaera sp. XPORK-15E TaxID=3110247 RepID=UPI002B210CA3|nr:ABC transporter permease [Crocosphaera sp. XPORK-15E]MEA5536263.1 ABC transporter permease [Crocosphaera sp. XPORK-15E]